MDTQHMDTIDRAGTDQMPGDTDLNRLRRLASHAEMLERDIENTEATLKIQKANMRTCLEVDIPEVMDSLGMQSFTLVSGRTLEVGPVVEGSIPVANRLEAFAWLRAHKHDGIIKNVVSVALGKGQDTLAASVVKTLEALGLTVDQKESVHVSTLKSWAGEMIREGRHLPLDLFGVFVGRRAKIKDPKGKKQKSDDE